MMTDNRKVPPPYRWQNDQLMMTALGQDLAQRGKSSESKEKSNTKKHLSVRVSESDPNDRALPVWVGIMVCGLLVIGLGVIGYALALR